MAGEFFTTSDTWEAQNLLMQLKWFCLLREFSSPISILYLILAQERTCQCQCEWRSKPWEVYSLRECKEGKKGSGCWRGRENIKECKESHGKRNSRRRDSMGPNLPRKLKRMKTEKRPLQLVLSGLHGKVRTGAWCKGKRNKYMMKHVWWLFPGRYGGRGKDETVQDLAG